MTKAQLQSQLEAKTGFVSIIKDEPAPDNVPGDPIEKRFFYVNHINDNGTAGKTFVYYLHNADTDEAWFYNVENEELDNQASQKKLAVLTDYCDATFDAYELEKVNYEKKWATVTTFTIGASNVTQGKAFVYKNGNNPVTHKDLV